MALNEQPDSSKLSSSVLEGEYEPRRGPSLISANDVPRLPKEQSIIVMPFDGETYNAEGSDAEIQHKRHALESDTSHAGRTTKYEQLK